MSSREGRAVVRDVRSSGRRRKSKDMPLNMSDLRIVLLGKSVSENSRVGNFLLGRSAFDSEAAPDVVERVGGRLNDRHVTVINSPQLLQTNISDRHITQTVRECVNLSDPGPHVIVLILKHEQSTAKDQECVEKVLDSFSERVYQHTMVLTTEEPFKTNDILQKITQKCFNRHFSLQSSSSPDDLLQIFEDIVQMNDGHHLICAEDEASQYFTMEQQVTERFSEIVKINLVLCGTDGTQKSSISELILQKTYRGSGVELHGRQINLVELPALHHLSEEEVMRQTLRCVSLCDPGVHVFLLIIPDAPLNNEDKAEMEKIQKIFSSRINKHIMILIMQNSEHQTAELNEETQSVIQSFGGRHHFFAPTTQVSTLMEKIEQMLEENRGEFFSKETFLETQMKKLLQFEEMKKKIHALETHLLSQAPRKNTNDLRIVLLGKTGVGKSATGNTILGRNAFTVETSHESVTKESQRQSSEINGRLVTVIDTPGLFDTELSNEQIQREISNCISMILPGPHVFLLLIPLGRFTKHEETAVKIIQETFGEKALMFTMVLFTRGDDLKNTTIDQFLGKPGSALMNLIEACGNRFHVFNNNESGDRTQVSDLLEKIDAMLNANGGSFYSCKMFREMEREKQEQQMKILLDRLREREEVMEKLEEEKERMKMIMEEERQNQDKARKRREKEFNEIEEQYKTLIKEMKEEMKREREEWEKQKERSPTPEPNIRDIPAVSPAPIRIVLLGKTGVGKSEAGNTILGQNVFRSAFSAASVTRKCSAAQTTVSGRSVSVVDTPGFFDTSLQHEQSMTEIMRSVYSSSPGPHAFLIVFRVDTMFTEYGEHFIEMIKSLFGEEVFRYSVVLFTFGDQLRSPIKKVIDWYPALGCLVDQCGDRFHVFNNKDQNNREQVNDLLEKIDSMIEQNGGGHYSYQMFEDAQRRRQRQICVCS